MFDIAPQELMLVAFVALVVIGPKDLPRAMRHVGKWVGRARGIARQFRSGIDTMIRESELAELEKQWAAENERIMREYPPSPSLPAPEPAADTQVIEHQETIPALVEQPAIVDTPAPKPRAKRVTKPNAEAAPVVETEAPKPRAKRVAKPKDEVAPAIEADAAPKPKRARNTKPPVEAGLQDDSQS